MASRDAVIDKRVRATERIKAALPGVEFRQYPAAGVDFQHAADLETIADALEQRSTGGKGEQPETQE
jgi:hypothetical protein